MNLLYQNRVPVAYRIAFVEKIIIVAKNLGVNPNWLMAIINFESAKTFSPSITNSLGYTGLIQFGAAAAKDLGTTTAALRVMTAVKQLDYVEKYYKLWYKRLKIVAPDRFVDFYLITLFPIAANKGNNFVIRSKDITAERFQLKNSGLDINNDGVVTIGEIEKKITANIPTEFLETMLKKKA